MEPSTRIHQLINLLKDEPEDLFLNYALGLEYAAEKNLQAATSQLQTVLKLDENYIAAYYQLGKLFEDAEDKTTALGYYKTGLEKAKLQKNNKAINEFGEAIFMLED